VRFNNIDFRIDRPQNLTLNDNIEITFRNNGFNYGAKFPMIIRSKIFGMLDLSELSDKELVLMCISNVFYKEYLSCQK